MLLSDYLCFQNWLRVSAKTRGLLQICQVCKACSGVANDASMVAPEVEQACAHVPNLMLHTILSLTRLHAWEL